MCRKLRMIVLIFLMASPTARADQDETNLTGVVVDESGQGVAGATIKANIRGKSLECKVDASGSFRLGLPTDLLASGRVWGSLLAEDADGRLGYLSVSQEREARKPVKVVLKPARDLVVAVMDREGNPVAGVEVDILNNMHRIKSDRTGRDGRWTTRVPTDMAGWAVFGRKAKGGMDYASAERARGSQEKPFPLPAEIKLTLDGARTLKVKVVDQNGKPIAGANVGPWLIQKPGHESDINLSGMLMRWPVTDQDGSVALDWLPETSKQTHSILAHAEGYHTLEHATWIPADKPVDVVTITMLPMERLSGRVTDAEGHPAAGVLIELEGQGGGMNNFRGTAQTGADGRYELKVYSDQAYVITATRGDLAAPYRSDIVVRAGQPKEGADLVLGKATRIRGRVTVGKDERPVPKAQVALVIRKGQIPKELVRPGDRFSREISLRKGTFSDDAGRYEFLVGPGDYEIQGPPRVEVPKISIPTANPPAEVVADLKMPRPEVGPFAVTVVDTEGKPVVGASVDGMYGSFEARRWFYTLKTDGKGSFRTERSLDPLVLHARTADGKLGGLFRSEAEATEAQIIVGPVATATGVLHDSDGQPVAKHKLSYGIRVHMGPKENSDWTETFGGTIETDDKGNFSLSQIVPGHEYHLTFPLDDKGSSRTVTKFNAKEPGPFHLGEVTVDTQPSKPYVPPTAKERTAAAFASRTKTSLTERLTTLLAEAKREYTRPLLLFGKSDDPACIELFRLFNERTTEAHESNDPAKRRPPTPAALRWEFELMSLDLAQADTLPFAQERGVAIDEGRTPILAVLNEDGKVASTYPLQLDAMKTLDGAALGRFLLAHKLATRDAETMLAEGLAKAKAEDKRVFFIASASWCGPCRMLARFLAPHKSALEPHFVFVKLDISRDLHAEAVRDRYKGAAEGGVPWYAILDGEGTPLATSNMPDEQTGSGSSNIGFPSTKPAVDHFVGMLRQTAPRLASDQIEELQKGLLKK